MATESCTTTRLDYWKLQGFVPEFEKQQQQALAFWSLGSAPEWTRHAGMELSFAMKGLHFCDACILASALVQHIWWTLGSARNSPYNEGCTSLRHNVTQVVTWRNYQLWMGRDGGTSPAPLAPFNRKVLKLKKPPTDLIFLTSVISSVWPKDYNRCTISIFIYFSSEIIKSC